MSTESKEEALRRMDETWPAFKALLDRVPESEYDKPGVVDEWSLKELLAHVIYWADKAAHDVRSAAAGKPDEIKAPGSDDNWSVDGINAEAASRGNQMSPGEAKAGAQRAHDAARQAVAEAPEAPLAIKVSGWTVGRRFAEDTYRHYEEHAEQIRAWLREMETTEK